MKLTALFAKLLLIGLALSYQVGFAQTTPLNATAALNAPNLRPVKGWYDGWLNKDWNSLTQSLAVGFTFSSPVDDHISLQAMKEKCWSNAYKMKRLDVDKVIVNGDNVIVIGNGWTTEDKLFRNCDYFRLKDGKIIAYECFFGPGINFPNNAGK